MTSQERRRKLRQLGFSEIEITGIEQLGLPPVVEMIFVGLLLQARAKTKNESYKWWRDLGLKERPLSREAARAAYSQAMLKAHPDHGGTMAAMAKVKAAWERAQQELPSNSNAK